MNTSASVGKPISRQSIPGAYLIAKKAGLQVKTVIDLGAAHGTPELVNTFPGARHFLVEPQEEFRKSLENFCAQGRQVFQSQGIEMDFRIAAVADQCGQQPFFVRHHNYYGSSLAQEQNMPEGYAATTEQETRMIDVYTLDALCEKEGLEGPYLVKVDVHGAENKVILGATETLKNTALFVVECNLYEVYEGVSLADEIASMLFSRGFCLYDMVPELYWPDTHNLAQINAFYVPKESPLRKAMSSLETLQRLNQSATKTLRDHVVRSRVEG